MPLALNAEPHPQDSTSIVDALTSDVPNPRTGARAIDIGHDPLPPVERRRGDLTVLDVTKWFGETSGGVRTYLQQKSAYVATRPGLRHVLVIPASRDLVTDRERVRWYRLRGPRVPSQRQYRFLLAARSLRRIVEHERPDVIEVGSPVFVPWICALAARGMSIPLVSFYHTNIVTLVSPSGLPGRLTAGALRAYARSLDGLFATTLVASSCAAADLERAGVTRTTRVPLGVDLETFSPRRRATAAQTKARLGLDPTRPLIVYAGRLAPEKSLHVPAAAWDRFSRGQGPQLAFVGDGPLLAELRQRTVHSDVRFLPFEPSRNRVADILAASDAFLAPGTSETFGLAALEAMACGTPVISADAGGVAEMVTRSGAGYLFRAGDAASLAGQVSQCLAASPESVGRAAREFVEREHGWDTVFDRIFDVYRTVTRAEAAA